MLTILVLTTLTHLGLAGRAFPVASENYAIEQFQGINYDIEWDPTNFLVDLSGQYATCNVATNRQRGQISVDRATPEGVSIGGLVDYHPGEGADAESIEIYLEESLSGWTREYQYREQILRAERFGCSVQPGCSGFIAVACLFSPSVNSGGGAQNIEGGSLALAFDEDQYQLAEEALGVEWNDDFFLENLSGLETDCGLLAINEWSFPAAMDEAEDREINLVGQYGIALNQGSTRNAISSIFNDPQWKDISAFEVGCSVIPDCIIREAGEAAMYVVITCIYHV